MLLLPTDQDQPGESNSESVESALTGPQSHAAVNGDPRPAVGAILAAQLASLGDCDTPVVACDLAGARRCLAEWTARFPGVHASTGAQALGSRPLTRLLASTGRVSFRAYSKSDLDTATAAGVPGHAVLLANPCKTRALISRARQLGVGVTVFDSADELRRLAAAWPEVELLLLVRFNTEGGCGGGLGADPSSCARLATAANVAGLRIAGLAVWLGPEEPEEERERDGRQVDHSVAAWASAAASSLELLSTLRRLGHPGADVVDLGSLSPKALAERAIPAFAAAAAAAGCRPPRLLCDMTRALLAASVVMATKVLDKSIEQRPLGGGGCYSYRLNGGLASGGRLCGLVGGGCGESSNSAARLVPSRLGDGCEPVMLPELRVGDWLLWRGLQACPTAARLMHCLMSGELVDSSGTPEDTAAATMPPACCVSAP